MIDHKERARRAWPLLVQRAQSRNKISLITYGQLTGKLGLHHRSASWLLGVIQRYCANHGLPPLQALVVNKRTRVPGAGYVGYGHGSKKLKQALTKVFLHKKWQLKAPF